MAAQYDGYIRISTKIDEKSAQAGLASLSSSLKKFSALVVTAFSVTAVVTFMKSCVTVSTELTNAWIGLKSVSEGIGRSFSESKTFLQDYIKDGLVPAKNAVAAYKNLLLRGYDTSQIEDIMTRLKDSASFARQGSLTMGQAVQSASEGLKNELSTLVDNAGVTKNVAQMWKDYADQIGKTTAQLTVADKRQAEYNGIMHETRFQVGDAAKLVNTYSGQVSMLTFNFTMLRASLGTGFIALLKPIVSWLNVLMVQLNATAEVFANFMSALFGQTQEFTTGAIDVTDAVDGLSTSTEEAGDAATEAGDSAEKGFAKFDEVNVLDTSSKKSTTKDKDPSATAEVSKKTADEVNDSVEEMKKKIKDFFGLYQEQIKETESAWSSLSDSAKTFIDELKTQFSQSNPFGALVDAGLKLSEALGHAFDLIIQAVGGLFLALNVPAILKEGLTALGSLFKAVGDIISSITPGVVAFVTQGLMPVAEWIGEKIVDALKFLSEQFTLIGAWFVEHKEDLTILGQKIGEVTGLLWNLIKPIADVAWDVFKQAIKDIIDVLLGLGTWITNNKQLVVNFLAVFITFKAVSFVKEILIIIGNFVKLIAQMAINNAQWLYMEIKLGIVTGQMVLNNIQWGFMWVKLQLANKELIISNAQWLIAEVRLKAAIIVSSLMNSELLLTGIRMGIIVAGLMLLIYYGSKIQENWKNMSSVEKVISVLGLLAIAAGVAAVAFGALQSAWTLGLAAVAIVAGTVAISAALKSAQSDAKSQVSSSVPHLASGAVIPPNREFMAVLGDQKRGTNIEAPLDTIKQGMSEVLDGIDLGGSRDNIAIKFTGSLAQIGRVLKPVIVREEKRTGKSLVEVGSYE